MEYKIIKTKEELEECKKILAIIIKREYKNYSSKETSEHFDDKHFDSYIEDSDKVLIGAYRDFAFRGFVTGHIRDYDDEKVAVLDDLYFNDWWQGREACLTNALKEWFMTKDIDNELTDGFLHLNTNLEFEIFIKYLKNEISTTELFKTLELDRGNETEYSLIKGFINNYKNLKFKFQNMPLYQKCYNDYIKYANNDISIGQYLDIVESSDISLQSYSLFGLVYAKDVKKVSNEELKILKRSRILYIKTLDLISNTDNEEEIFNILTDYGRFNKYGKSYGNKKLSSLSSKIHNYLIVKYGDTINMNEYNVLKESLSKKIKNAMNKHNEITKEKERMNLLPQMLEEANNTIIEFIKGNNSLDLFLKEKNISRSHFNNLLSVLKENNEKLYKQYADYSTQKHNQLFAVLMHKADFIANAIINGVVDDEKNIKRAYDLLDYYSYSNLDLTNFLELVKRLNYNAADYRKIRTFVEKNKVVSSGNKVIAEIKKSKMIVNNVEVTDEQKDNVLRYLKSINAPISTKIFKIAMRRYLNNELNIEKEDSNNMEHGSKNR